MNDLVDLLGVLFKTRSLKSTRFLDFLLHSKFTDESYEHFLYFDFTFDAQVPECQNGQLIPVQWFNYRNGHNIQRHDINDRKQMSIRRKYARGILRHGILEGCRGEPWLVMRPGFSNQVGGNLFSLDSWELWTSQ